MATFTRAERRKAKLRLGLVGPSGSGKTFSALKIAKGMGGKIALIDTENRSADLYAGVAEFDTCVIEAPYTITKYLDAIKSAENAGYDIIIIDSISHAWAGDGGLLDKQGKIADSGRGNSYTAWRQVTPEHNKFIEAMLASKCHIIATMRAKVEYVQEQNDRGKTEIRKVGMAPVQREGMDYEFTVVYDLDIKHQAQASKDRTSLFDGQIFQPCEDTGIKLMNWLNCGADTPPPPPVKEVAQSAPAKAAEPAPKAEQDPLTLVDTKTRKAIMDNYKTLGLKEEEILYRVNKLLDKPFEKMCVGDLPVVRKDFVDLKNESAQPPKEAA